MNGSVERSHASPVNTTTASPAMSSNVFQPAKGRTRLNLDGRFMPLQESVLDVSEAPRWFRLRVRYC